MSPQLQLLHPPMVHRRDGQTDGLLSMLVACCVVVSLLLLHADIAVVSRVFAAVVLLDTHARTGSVTR